MTKRRATTTEGKEHMLGKLTIAAAAAMLSAASLAVASTGSGPWGSPVEIDDIDGNSDLINTTAADGCPILSPDGRDLYIATNRAGTLDIYVAHRDEVDEPFGDPEPIEEINSPTAADFCPTPLQGKRLLFVSNRGTDGHCGMGDIFITRKNPRHGWGEPRRLPCAPEGPNTGLDEQGPSLIEVGEEQHLYFSSSNAPSVPGEIYLSRDFGPGTAVTELNSPGNDIQPNVRKDGLEIVFSSNRGTAPTPHQDIWTATRASTDDPWSAPTPVSVVNTGASETRPSLSWDAHTLLFGRAPGGEGANDIYVSTR